MYKKYSKFLKFEIRIQSTKLNNGVLWPVVIKIGNFQNLEKKEILKKFLKNVA